MYIHISLLMHFLFSRLKAEYEKKGLDRPRLLKAATPKHDQRRLKLSYQAVLIYRHDARPEIESLYVE